MRTTNHPVEAEELMAWLDGELPPGPASRVAAHAGSCRQCQEMAADLRHVSARMLDWPVEAPAMAAPVGTFQKRERPVYQRRWIWALATVCIVVAAVGLVSRTASRSAENFAFNPAPEKQAAPAPPPAQPGAQVPPAGPLIVHTASLTVVANNFDHARDTLQDILKRHHGYIAEMTVSAEEASSRSLTATLKTPDAQLDATIAEIKTLGRVVSEQRGGEDVTQQSMDLDARLANARNAEQRLTDLLRNRTDKLADILAVENQISEVRGQIEQMEAARKNLTNRIDYAKIDVRITEEYKAALGSGQPSSLTQLRNAAVDGLHNLSANLLGVVAFLLSYGPVLLVWIAILFFPARFAWRRCARR